jgi:citrate lyase subunit beta/citryl-CoA lyase
MDAVEESPEAVEKHGRPSYQWYRSYLYVPATEPRRVEQALTSEADAVVIDLEDAVPPERKGAARRAVRDLLLAHPAKPTFVRVNGFHSGLLESDIETIACPGLTGVRLPKTESPEQVRSLLDGLRRRGCDVSVVPIIESALGVERAFEIATADPGIAALAMGEADLALDLAAASDELLDYARARCVVASRAGGLAGTVQSVCTRLDDDALLRATTLRGRAMGFSGRSAIHPRQLPIINEVFTPSEDERRWAEEVLDSYRRALAGGDATAVTPSGEFVDQPVLRRASAILELAAQLSD